MNPITALMLSRSIEADRRRELDRRGRVFFARPTKADEGGRRSWLLRIRLLRPAATRP